MAKLYRGPDKRRPYRWHGRQNGPLVSTEKPGEGISVSQRSISILVCLVLVGLAGCGSRAGRGSGRGATAPGNVSAAELSSTVWPVWGAHLPYGSKKRVELRPDPEVIRDLGIRVTTVWLYPRRDGRFDVGSSVNLVKQAQTAGTGLDVYVHIMPNAKAEARQASGAGRAPRGGGSPEASSTGDIQNSASGDGEIGGAIAFHLPSDMDGYLSSLEALAAALEGSVNHFSIGNEVSGLTWKGGAADYAELVRRSAEAIRRGNPEAVILDSGMAGLTYAMTIPATLQAQGRVEEALVFVREFLKQRVGGFSRYLPLDDEAQLAAFLERPEVKETVALSEARFRELCPYYDRLQLHDYQGWQTLDEIFGWLREQMRSNGCEKPIEFWEAGYGVERGHSFDPQDQADSVAKIMAISGANGARAVIWFPLVDRGSFGVGLISGSGEVRPAATAYRTAAGLLSSLESSHPVDVGLGTEAYAFERSGKGVVLVLWAEEPLAVEVPMSASRVRVYHVDGSSEVLEGSTVQVDPSPVFVEAA